MSKYILELEKILNEDPLGILSFQNRSKLDTDNERLVDSFKEICRFYESHNRIPNLDGDIEEIKLFSRLKTFRKNESYRERLVEHDTYGLLKVDEKEIAKENLKEIVHDDPLGILEDDGPEVAIYKLKHVPKKQTMPDVIAKRKSCENFEKFEPLFLDIHKKLTSGECRTQPFNSERQISPGEFFVLGGMLVLVAEIGNWERKNFGNYNAKTHCVFENGTESKLLLRSLAAALWKDNTSRHVIASNQIEIFSKQSEIETDDKGTGFIYILQSLSNDPKIASIDNLFKIGYTSDLNNRFLNCESDPTFLMAKVKLIADFKVFNLNALKFEKLLHRFFADACLDLEIVDLDRTKASPREWFIVPFEIIEEAITYILNGQIVNYRYNKDTKSIIRR